MSLSFTNTAGNLFNRLGRFGRLARLGRVFQGDLKTYYDALLAQFDSSVASPLQSAVDGVAGLRDLAREGAVGAYMNGLILSATRTVQEMVKADKPTAAGTLAEALEEVRKQMVAAGASVQQCAVTATTAAAGTNSGDGVLVATTKRGDGRILELIIPEVSYVNVVADSQTTGATAGSETLQYIGEVSSQTVWSQDYPIGSGISTVLTAIDTGVDGTAGIQYGNVLVNGDMESFTSNTPNNWTAAVGTAGVDFQQGATVYSGTKSLQFIGGATNTALYQEFNNSTGSPVALSPSTSYAIAFRARMDVAPAAGVLTVELVDSGGTVINDDQGVANSFTVNLVTLGTSFVSQTGVFRLPKSVPSVVRLRLRMSTALSVSRNLFVDHMAMGRVTTLYDGGPGLAAFSGNAKFVIGDYFTLTTTNDFGGSSNLSTFHWLLDQLFGLRSIGVLFPVSGAPTVPDTIITA